MSYIDVDNLSMTYPNGHEVLKRIITSMERNTLTFLTGGAGSGKSTLVNLLFGLLKPTSGTVRVDSVDIHDLSHQQQTRYRRNIGFISPRYGLLDQRTMFENVAIPLWAQGLNRKAVALRTDSCLERLKLNEYSRMYPTEISESARQRGTIARAIANEPMLLLADEPTEAMNHQDSESVIDLFRNYMGEERTIIVASRDVRLFESGDRVLQISNQQVSEFIV